MVETRTGRRFAVVFFLAAFLVFLLGRWLAPVDHAALTVAAPFVSALSTVSTRIGDGVSGVFEGPKLRQQNQDLEKKIGLLVTENVKLQEAAHENALFRRMLRFQSKNPNLDLVRAYMIGSDPNGLSPSILISTGTRDGLRLGMTVLDQHGYFVGSISDVWSNAAKVQLLLNPSSSVGAMDLRSRARGVVDGKFAADPQLDDVVTSASLQKGDFIVTSGDYNLFPRTILIGEVVRVHHTNSDLSQTADIQPAADFRSLEILQVVRGFVPSRPNTLVTGP